MSIIRKILFVCTGNTCRSVMAERLMKHMLSRKKDGFLPLEVSSAGLCAYGGPATDKTRKVLNREGIDIDKHFSRQVTREQIRSADLILVMTGEHREALISLEPEAEDRIKLLKTFDESAGGVRDISDPYGMGLESYQETLQEIKKSIMGLISSMNSCR